MGSTTWLVAWKGRRWVAKSVAPIAGGQFGGGLRVAAALDAAGIPSGAPEPTCDGRPVVVVDGRPLALLRFVEGVPLAGADPDEQRLIGHTLARAHRALRGVRVAGSERFHWVRPQADHLALRPWIRPAVTDAVAALDESGPGSLSWGLLHADPAPGHFLFDASTGRCGLIDWSVGWRGRCCTTWRRR